MVRALDLKSGGCGFKSRSDHLLELFCDSPEFSSSATFVNSQLVCLLPVGVFNLVFNLSYLFLKFNCSAPLAFGYNHRPRVNKGYLFCLFIYMIKVHNNTRGKVLHRLWSTDNFVRGV